jgi:hypothetical protein
LYTGKLTLIGEFEGGAGLAALAIPCNWSGAPHADFTWTPTIANPGKMILFNASGSYDPNGYFTLYEWDWDNDKVFDENHTNPTASHSWPIYGYYPVTLKVTDNSSKTEMRTKTVRVGNQPPTAPTIIGPTGGGVGTEYKYTFITTDPDKDALYYYIEWGDGDFVEWIGPYNSGKEVIIGHT